MIDREIVFAWSLLAGGGGALRPGGDAEPVVGDRLHGVARRVLRSRVGQRLHAAAGERRRRVPRPDLRALTTLARMFLFLSLAAFPRWRRSSSRSRTRWARISSTSAATGSTCRERGSRSGSPAWSSSPPASTPGDCSSGTVCRRPVPLTLVPKLKRPPATGLFIAFEGVEGSGKGTQIRMAEEHLRSLGLNVLVTREPGGTSAGADPRAPAGSGDRQAGCSAPRRCCSRRARAQTVASVIRPALAEGKVVIRDRYVDSSLAYQGWARGLGEPDVLSLNVWATQGLFPDMVILLHIEPERGLARSDEPSTGWSRRASSSSRRWRTPTSRSRRNIRSGSWSSTPTASRRPCSIRCARRWSGRSTSAMTTTGEARGIDGRRVAQSAVPPICVALSRLWRRGPRKSTTRPAHPVRSSAPVASLDDVQMVLEQVPGQDAAMTFLRGAAERPHHAYVFAGPEGSGKSLAARAFAASLLCANGGCGECRDCRLALRDQHPNEFVVEPEGRDIHVDTVRDEVWHPAYLTAPEPGRKVFLIREADRLVPGRRRHAAEGLGGAAGRRRLPPAVGSGARAARRRSGAGATS